MLWRICLFQDETVNCLTEEELNYNVIVGNEHKFQIPTIRLKTNRCFFTAFQGRDPPCYKIVTSFSKILNLHAPPFVLLLFFPL